VWLTPAELRGGLEAIALLTGEGPVVAGARHIDGGLDRGGAVVWAVGIVGGGEVATVKGRRSGDPVTEVAGDDQ
jgi:hypothetical protein